MVRFMQFLVVRKVLWRSSSTEAQPLSAIEKLYFNFPTTLKTFLKNPGIHSVCPGTKERNCVFPGDETLSLLK